MLYTDHSRLILATSFFRNNFSKFDYDYYNDVADFGQESSVHWQFVGDSGTAWQCVGHSLATHTQCLTSQHLLVYLSILMYQLTHTFVVFMYMERGK